MNMTDRKMKHLWMVEDVAAKDGRDKKSWWTKIGVAFENRDGSYSLDLKAFPMNGRLQMRDPMPPRVDGASQSPGTEALQ